MLRRDPGPRLGLLTLAILAVAVPAALFLPTSSFAGAGTKTLSIAATTPLRNTGITLARGRHAKIAASGLISYNSQNPACEGARITPNGCSAESICRSVVAAAL